MKRELFCIAFILLAGVGVSAQSTEKVVEQVRAAYNSVSEKARLAESDDDQGLYGDLVVNELVINKRGHQWRAVGIFRETYTFFYGGGNSEKHLYPDELVMVKVTRTLSNRRYDEEFLFDKAGRLIFYFQRAENDETVPRERRIYFSATRAIRVVEDGKTRKRLSPKDVKTVGEVAADSTKIKDLFRRSIKL